MATYHVGDHQVTERDIVYVARLGTQVTSHSNPMCPGIEPGSTVTSERWETARGDLFCPEHCIDHLSFGRRSGGAEPDEPFPGRTPSVGTTPGTEPRPQASIATEKQMAFIESLMAERALDGDPMTILFPADNGAKRRDGQLTKSEASKLIELLQALPRGVARPTLDTTVASPSTAGLDLSDLPAGRYAVPGGDTRLKVHIDKPSGGKWAGWVFVKDGAEYGASRRYGNQRPGSTYQGDIRAELATILADPAGAMGAYGHLTGTCGACGRHLEDAQSVARGIGPICWGKLGF